mgnify:CR=1 FL=1
MKPNILIVDDEVIASAQIYELFEEVAKEDYFWRDCNVEVINSPKKAKTIIAEKNITLVFLDIQMPGINGIDIAKEINALKKIKKTDLPAIIFTTAYDKYAIQGFELEAVDYLLKPVTKHKFHEALNKFKKLHGGVIEKGCSVEVTQSGRKFFVPIKDIVYFQAELKYVTIYTGNHEYICDFSLNQLENQFPHLIRIHRSYLINPQFCKQVLKHSGFWQAMMNTGKLLPIARRQKGEIRSKMEGDILKNADQYEADELDFEVDETT